MILFIAGLVGLLCALLLFIAFCLARSSALGDDIGRDVLTDEKLDIARERLRDSNVFQLPAREERLGVRR